MGGWEGGGGREGGGVREGGRACIILCHGDCEVGVYGIEWVGA